MWEPTVTNYPPETVPTGVRQPPPRFPPAPPGTGETPASHGDPYPTPSTLRAALRECLLHVRSIRLSLHGEAEFRRDAQMEPELTRHFEELIDTMHGMRRDAGRYLSASFDRALLLALRRPERSPDADHVLTKSRLIRAIREEAQYDKMLDLLEMRSFFGTPQTPPPSTPFSRLSQPAGCPEWALELLPPRSVVRWVMEDLARSIHTAENHDELARFDAAIAFPLAVLMLALPSRSPGPGIGLE